MTLRRGISNLLLVGIVFTVLIIAFMLYAAMIQSARYSIAQDVQRFLSYIEMYNYHRLAVVNQGSSTNITNVGTAPTSIEFVALNTSNGVEMLYMPKALSNCTNLNPFQSCRASLSGEPITIVTRGGVVIHPEHISVPVQVGNYTRVYTISFQGIAEPQKLAKIFDVNKSLIEVPYPGGEYNAVISEAPLYLSQNITNANVYLSGEFGVLIVGYSPAYATTIYVANASSTPTYNIMVTSVSITGSITNSSALANSFGIGYRIELLNFSGVIELYNCSTHKVIACSPPTSPLCQEIGVSRRALGVWYYSHAVDLCFNISGYAQQALIFAPGNGEGNTTYYPYIYLGDVDGDGLVDFMLVTESVGYGNASTVDDSYGAVDMSTASGVPLTLYINLSAVTGYRNGAIPGALYSGVYLFINFWFHDDSYPDTQQLNDNPDTRTLLRIVLINASNPSDVIDIRDYAYQEVANYHQTLIHNVTEGALYYSKLSQLVYVPIPPKGLWRLAIQIQDPYFEEYNSLGCVNDADFTIGIEIMGIVLLYR